MAKYISWLRATVVLLLGAGCICACLSGSANAIPGQESVKDGLPILFANALEAYKKGQYGLAIDLNRQALAAGGESAAVYYNLANSYFRNGQVGPAILNYRRALSLDPRDADIRANLALARNTIVDTDTAPVPGADERFKRIFDWLSTAELRWLCLVFFMLVSGYVLYGLYRSEKSGRLAALGVIGGLVLGVLLFVYLNRIFDDATAAVLVRQAEARFEPSAGATVYFRLPEGAEVRTQLAQDGWVKIARTDGRTGWVPSETLEKAGTRGGL